MQTLLHVPYTMLRIMSRNPAQQPDARPHACTAAELQRAADYFLPSSSEDEASGDDNEAAQQAAAPAAGPVLANAGDADDRHDRRKRKRCAHSANERSHTLVSVGLYGDKPKLVLQRTLHILQIHCIPLCEAGWLSCAVFSTREKKRRHEGSKERKAPKRHRTDLEKVSRTHMDVVDDVRCVAKALRNANSHFAIAVKPASCPDVALADIFSSPSQGL